MLSHITAGTVAHEVLTRSTVPNDLSEENRRAIAAAIAEVVRRMNGELEREIAAMKDDISRAQRR